MWSLLQRAFYLNSSDLVMTGRPHCVFEQNIQLRFLEQHGKQPCSRLSKYVLSLCRESALIFLLYACSLFQNFPRKREGSEPTRPVVAWRCFALCCHVWHVCQVLARRGKDDFHAFQIACFLAGAVCLPRLLLARFLRGCVLSLQTEDRWRTFRGPFWQHAVWATWPHVGFSKELASRKNRFFHTLDHCQLCLQCFQRGTTLWSWFWLYTPFWRGQSVIVIVS